MRNAAIQTFLTSLRGAFAAAETGPDAVAALGRIFDALEVHGAEGDRQGLRRPVCNHVGTALALARETSAPLAALADAFAALEPGLRWRPRPEGGPFMSDNWLEGHANATIIGPDGLETRRDVAIGASLLAPHVRYPDHRHPPEEVYVLLSPGRFQHGGSAWFAPGAGGTLYNAPAILHAMASDAAPLLAIWCLWTGESR